MIGAESPSSDVESATLIGRNVSFRLAGQILSALINVGGMVLLGNFLGSSGYGNYAFYYALIPLIASMSDLGVGAIITREIARNRADGPRLLGDAICIKAAVSGALLLVGGTLAWTIFDPLRATLLTVVLAAALMDFSQDISVWVFRAHERQDLESLLLLVSQIGWVAGIAACAALGASLVSFLATATAAFAVRLGVGAWILSRRMYRPRFAPEWARIRRLVLQGIPFGLAMLGIVLYGRIGVLMLQTLASASQVALFNVAYMLSQPLGFISTAVSMSTYPVFSRDVLRGPAAVRPTLLQAIKYQIVVALPLTAGLFFASDRLVPLLFHREGFAGAALAIRVMSTGLVFIFMNLMSRYLLTAMDRQRLYLRAVLGGLVVNAAFGMLLIPSYGFLGACAGQLAGELTIFIVCQAALSKYIGAMDLVRTAWRPLAAAVFMGLVVFSVRQSALFLIGAAGVLAYAAMLLALRAISADEIQILRCVYVSFGLPGSARLKRAAERS
ncbi:MAG: flippase [Candidatus Eisenbacteria bacterium]|uniref:Flippase n=1 Tax=Eiseniibacteriota bacterium TaxID=2212470 RepID=A0A538T2D7_UNCEI|nr:MAG: flippase [Candidatus Eisenbacteria bacterium]